MIKNDRPEIYKPTKYTEDRKKCNKAQQHAIQFIHSWIESYIDLHSSHRIKKGPLFFSFSFLMNCTTLSTCLFMVSCAFILSCFLQMHMLRFFLPVENSRKTRRQRGGLIWFDQFRLVFDFGSWIIDTKFGRSSFNLCLLILYKMSCVQSSSNENSMILVN